MLPQEGTIAAGEAMQVTVTFSPQEVDSFARTLRCACSNLAEGDAPPTVTRTLPLTLTLLGAPASLTVDRALHVHLP